MCYPRITNLVLPYPYIDNYTKVINGVKWIYNDCGEPEITINDTNINIVSPVKVDTTGNDNIELSVDIIDDQSGESISSFNKLGGDYYAAIGACFNTTSVIDNLVNEECGEIINTYNSDIFQLPVNVGKDKTYTMNITYLGKTVTKYITQPCYQSIIVETPSDYTGFNYVEIQNHPTSDNINDEGEPFLEPYVLFSSKNQNIHNSCSSMKIKIDGFESFKLYIRSYAESYNDYIMVSKLDTDININTSYSNSSLVIAHTRGNQQSGTDINNYTLVEFTNIDTSIEHYITVVFRKDSSVNYIPDTGYILIPNINLETVYITPDAAYPITISYLDEGLTWNDDGEVEFIDGNKYRRFTSISQYHDFTACKMRIDITGLSTFDFYIGSSSENGWDFVGVRLDNEISYDEIENNYGGTYSSWDEFDYWYDTSVGYDEINSSDITQYKHIQFTELNNTAHYIEVAYVKDSSGYEGEDVGFVVIPNKYQITINEWESCPGDGTDCPGEEGFPEDECVGMDDGDFDGDGWVDDCPDTDGDGISDYA